MVIPIFGCNYTLLLNVCIAVGGERFSLQATFQSLLYNHSCALFRDLCSQGHTVSCKELIFQFLQQKRGYKLHGTNTIVYIQIRWSHHLSRLNNQGPERIADYFLVIGLDPDIIQLQVPALQNSYGAATPDRSQAELFSLAAG
jgi:hypothetical protein